MWFKHTIAVVGFYSFILYFIKLQLCFVFLYLTCPVPRGAPRTLCRLPLLMFLFEWFYFIIQIILFVDVMLEQTGVKDEKKGEKWKNKQGRREKRKKLRVK